MEFPQATIEAAIREEIMRSAEDRPPTKSGWRPEVDSLTVVCVVLRVERELGFDLPEDITPAGGFDDVESCVRSILETSRQLWREEKQVVEEGAS